MMFSSCQEYSVYVRCCYIIATTHRHCSGQTLLVSTCVSRDWFDHSFTKSELLCSMCLSAVKSYEYKSLTMLFSLLCRIFYLRHFLENQTLVRFCTVYLVSLMMWCLSSSSAVLHCFSSIILLRSSTPAAMQCMVGSRWVNINGKT